MIQISQGDFPGRLSRETFQGRFSREAFQGDFPGRVSREDLPGKSPWKVSLESLPGKSGPTPVQVLEGQPRAKASFRGERGPPDSCLAAP